MTSAPEPHGPLPESAEARIYELCLGGGDVAAGLRELQQRHPHHAAALAALVRDLQRADSMVGGVRDLAGSSDAGLAPGTTWGNYRIVREIGRGGFGSVYLAEQHEPVRREVALKVVSAAATTPDMLQRFAAERQVLAQLSHPAIARVLDAGTTPAGQPFFAMDFLPGSPIAACADEHRLGIAARLQLFLEVCHAVQHAHQRGVLHRDLKPGNMLVADRDGRLVPYVIDFGLAKVLQQDAAPGAVGTTEFGRLLGTPEYMSPEQAMGEPVDTRTDVYSLGVILFELLTGELPFSSERLRARGLGTVVQVLANEEPPLPSTALEASATATVAAHRRSTTVQDLARHLRGDLDGIVHACLQKDREQRYGSVAELAADVQRHLHHEPITVARPGALYLLGKFARRHRAWFAASVLGGLGLLSGTAAIGWSLVRVTDARDRAIASADAASRNAYAAAIAAAQSAGESCRADAMRAHLAGTEPALRNLEWHVLQAQSEDALQVLAAGFDIPHCLVLHGTQATWFDAETSHIRCADLATGEVTGHGEHPWQVVQVVASRDGTRLVTGGTEGRLGVVDARGFTLQRELRIGGQQVRGIALMPDGRQCLAADDRELVLLDLDSGAEVARLRGHDSFCWSVDIAPDGARAASGDQDGKVRLWDLGRRETLHVLPHPATVRQVLFHPDGSLLATAARDGVIRLWDARDGRLLASQATGAPLVHALGFAPDGSVLASAQSDGSVRAWDATTLLDLGAHRGHSAYVAGIGHAVDGTLVTCAWDGTVRTWPARPRARHRSLEGMVGNTMRMALHPTEPVLAACSLGGEVAAWDLRDGRRLFARDLGGGMAHGIAFHPAGERLYVTSDRGGIHVLDARTGAEREALPSRRMRVRDLQFRPGRDQLLVGGSNGEVVLLQASGLEVVQRMQPPPGSTVQNAMRTVVDPGGSRVVGCDPGYALRAWTIDGGTMLWERTTDGPLDAGFAPDGALFACTASGHVVELDPATGSELRRFGRGNPHQPVTHLQVTPDGQRLVTTDQRLRIWDLQAGRELLALDTVRYEPGAVLALPERGVLAAGGGYFTEPAELLLWPLGR